MDPHRVLGNNIKVLGWFILLNNHRAVQQAFSFLGTRACFLIEMFTGDISILIIRGIYGSM